MNYKEAFVINDIHYNKLKEDEKNTNSNFDLNNFDYYEPKLIEDFYLKHFLRKFLFDIDILNLEQFIYYQYDYCKNPNDFISIIKYKVDPIAQDIIDNAGFALGHEGYYKEIRLEDDFAETEGVIKNYQYEVPFFYYTAGIRKNKAELLKRVEILKTFIEKLDSLVEGLLPAPLEWVAGSAQLGFIISMLVQNGYIKPPIGQKNNGKNKGKIGVNHSQLARDVLAAFKIPGQGSENSLKLYLNPTNYKNTEISKKLISNGFFLPKYDQLD
ncbi:hypothetical protein ACGK9U_01655 [Mariniflexile sp. HNIBRBA6329]|uniref:hypothetical protein n=1 Tax=Mariniflexile sp. HNIBRBA6329 TaxID=3373088 RepID=UPI00374553C3